MFADRRTASERLSALAELFGASSRALPNDLEASPQTHCGRIASSWNLHLSEESNLDGRYTLAAY